MTKLNSNKKPNSSPQKQPTKCLYSKQAKSKWCLWCLNFREGIATSGICEGLNKSQKPNSLECLYTKQPLHKWCCTCLNIKLGISTKGICQGLNQNKKTNFSELDELFHNYFDRDPKTGHIKCDWE